MVDRLRQRAGLPMPVVAMAPHDQPNAFATGRSPEHAVVAVTTGILKYMPQEELKGVIAHELAHIKNRDMLITTLAAGIAGAISNLPYLIMFGGGPATTTATRPAQLGLLLLAPIGGDADPVRGVAGSGSSRPTGSAPRSWGGRCRWPTRCDRLDALAHRIPMDVAPAAAPLAQVNPLAAHGGGWPGLFTPTRRPRSGWRGSKAMAAGR